MPVRCRSGALSKEKGATLVAPFLLRLIGALVVRRLAYHALAADAELAALDRDLDGVAVLDAALEDLRRQRVLQAALDHPLQRPRAVDRVVAAVGQPLQGLAVELDVDLAIGQQLAQAAELDLDDVRHVRA